MSDFDAYIRSIPPQRHNRFMSIHELIIQLYPDASVNMSNRIGVAWVALANQKQYISQYTCSTSHLASYKHKYPQQKTDKGCINFRGSDEIHYDGLESVIWHAIESAKA